MNSGSVPELLAAGDGAPRPLEHDAKARRQEVLGFLERDPAILVVLGAAELGRHGKLDLDFLGLAEVIARDLVPGVGQRLPVFLAEGEIDAREAGLLFQLALRGAQLFLARIDQALRKIPVVVRAQHEDIHAATGAPEHDHARRTRRRLGLHAEMLLPDLNARRPSGPGPEEEEASEARTARQA